MNRRERRAGRWDKLNPRVDYDGLISEAGEDGRKLLLSVLRGVAGQDAPFDDRSLWEGFRELINAGLLNVYIRIGADGLEVRPDFIIPNDNDNHHQPRGAA